MTGLDQASLKRDANCTFEICNEEGFNIKFTDRAGSTYDHKKMVLTTDVAARPDHVLRRGKPGLAGRFGDEESQSSAIDNSGLPTGTLGGGEDGWR